MPQLAEDPELSRKLALHVKYMETNNVLSHHEDRSRPGYTDDGHYAGTHSVLYRGVRDPVSGWVGTPFHGAQVLNPRLTTTGFALSAPEVSSPYSGMDTLTHYRGAPHLSTVATWPSGRTPIYRYSGYESPDPMQYCDQRFKDRDAALGPAPGTGVGPTLFASFPGAEVFQPQPVISSVEFTNVTTGESIPVCTGINDRSFSLSTMMMPLHPLKPGHRYSGTMVTDKGTATWKFTADQLTPQVTDFGLLDGKIAAGLPVAMPEVEGPTGAVRYETRAAPADDSTSGEDGWSTLTVSTVNDVPSATLPVGRLQLRVTHPGTVEYKAVQRVYTLDALPVAFSYSGSASPAIVDHGQTAYFSGSVTPEAPDEDSYIVGDVTAQLLYRQGGGAWRVLGSDNGYVSGQISVTAVRPEFMVRALVGSTVVGQSPVYRGPSVRRVITGFVPGNYSSFTLTTRKGTVVRRTVTIKPRTTAITLQYRPNGMHAWRYVRNFATDSTGRAVVTLPQTSGQYRMYYPLRDGYSASGTGVIAVSYR